MQSDHQKNINVKLLDFINLHPSTIKHINYQQDQKRIYIARQHYSEIIEIGWNNGKPVLQQITEFQPSKFILNINGTIALFKPFQLKIFRNNRWEYHSFTTQLLSIRNTENGVLTFHQKQTMSWTISDQYLSYKYLPQLTSPYHLNVEGAIVGMGKKLQPPSKGSYTACEVIQGKWVFIGDDRGGLHVYDWKLFAHVKSFREHAASILAIKTDLNSNIVYFSGSDSKVCAITLSQNQWHLTGTNRGQSHDIFSLEIIDKHLVSGGVTTDLCFYPSNKQLDGEVVNKVSYFGTRRVSQVGKYLVVNKRQSFEIWQIGQTLYKTTLCVKYDMPEDKFIIDAQMDGNVMDDGSLLIIVVTQQDTIGWKFSSENGLSKYLTISNQYQIIQLLPKHCFVGMRNDKLIQKVNCINGHIQQIAYSSSGIVTDMKYIGISQIIMINKLTGQISTVSLKKKQIIFQRVFNQKIGYIQNYTRNQFIIQFFNNPTIYKFQKNQSIIQLTKLPVNIIRFGGWVQSITKGKSRLRPQSKKYWYGISEGKIVIVSNLLNQGKKIKIRTKQTERMAQVFRPTGKLFSCELAVIPYNFQKMIGEHEIKPVFTKKIL